MNHQRPIHTTLQLLGLGLLIAASFWILQPFLLALLWATIIVVATWPVLIRIQSRLWNKRWLAVAVVLPAAMLILIVPLTVAVLMIVNHSSEIAEHAKSLLAKATLPPPQWVERIPLAGHKIAEEWQKLAAGTPDERAARVLPVVNTIVAWFVSKAGGIGVMVINLLLTLVIVAILYLYGETAAQGVRRFARRFGGASGEDTIQLAVQAVRGVALGVIGTAIIQSVFAGIGLMIAGVPFAAILTAIMVVLSIAQVGALPVLIPAVIWLYWTGHPAMGTFLLVWSVVATLMDNIIRPMLIKSGVDLPLLLIMAGVIGGLIAFGVVGLFVGPVVLAVSYTLLVTWIRREEPAS